MLVYKGCTVRTTSAVPSHKLGSEEALEFSGARAVAVVPQGRFPFSTMLTIRAWRPSPYFEDLISEQK